MWIFNSLADLFQWILVNNYSVPDILHYLDDYLTQGPPALPVCGQSLHAIQQAASDTGIPLAPGKIEGPTTCLTFLGIELDSHQMTARLPPAKLSELLALTKLWTDKKTCTRKELESLIGKLSHTCYVVPAGRTFMRRLINLLRDSKRYWKIVYASGKQGFGVYNNGAWFCRAWLPIQQPLSHHHHQHFI